MQKVRQSCNQIKKDPSCSLHLKNFSQIFKDLPSKPAQKLELMQQVIQVFQHFDKSGLFAKGNNSINSFFIEKLKVIQQCILKALNLQQTELEIKEKYFNLFSKVTRVSYKPFQEKMCQQVYLKLSDQFQQNFQWSLLTDASSITVICDYLKQSNLQVSNIHGYISFVTELPAFEQLLFQGSQAQIDVNNESSLSKEKKHLKDSYQRLLLKTLSASEQLDQHQKVELYRKLGQKVFSKLLTPLVLSQFFLKKFETTPNVQIQVLSSLFILVGKYGLQLDEFFQKLQILIKSRHQGKSVYELPNARRFFKLVQASLRSSKVPLKIIIQMAEIILSQVFQQSSDFSFWAFSFVFNLAKKHRKLLEHLLKMPQVGLLRRHYNPKIRKIVQQLDTNLNKAEYLDIDLFSGIKTDKLMRQRLKKLKQKFQQGEQVAFRAPLHYQKL